MNRQLYTAPWGTSVKLVTVLSFGVCGWAFYILTPGLDGTSWLGVAAVGVGVLVLACALSMVRGYELRGQTLVVHRPGRETRVDLTGLREVEYDSHAMKRSVRLAGNGGFFSLTGLWWNRKLGRYRAYVMDPKRAVVLRTDRRTVIVSPDRPAEFVAVVREQYPVTTSSAIPREPAT